MAKSKQTIELEAGFNIGDIVEFKRERNTTSLLVTQESHFDTTNNNVFDGVVIYTIKPGESVGDTFENVLTCNYTRLLPGSTVVLTQE